MLFENYFTDSRGNVCSAGVIETTVSELVKVIESLNLGIKSLVWEHRSGLLYIYFGNESSLTILFENETEKWDFVSHFDHIRYIDI